MKYHMLIDEVSVESDEGIFMNLKYIIEGTSSPSTFKLIVEKYVLYGEEMTLFEKAAGHCMNTDLDTVTEYARMFARNLVTPISINEILYDICAQKVSGVCELQFCYSE